MRFRTMNLNRNIPFGIFIFPKRRKEEKENKSTNIRSEAEIPNQKDRWTTLTFVYHYHGQTSPLHYTSCIHLSKFVKMSNNPKWWRNHVQILLSCTHQ